MAETEPDDDAATSPNRDNITEWSSPLLYRLAYQPQVEVKGADLARIWDLPEPDAMATLAELANGGLVEIWEERSSLCLTPLAAERLNLVMVTDARNRHQWHTRGTRAAEARERRASRLPADGRTIRESELAEADEPVLDALPGPTSVELAETTQPTLLYGIGMIWPGPSVEQKVNGKCRGCGHKKKLEAIGYCVICCRSGNANLRAPVQLTTVVTSKPSAPTPDKVKQGEKRDNAPVRPPALAGGIGSRPEGQKRPKKQAVKIA